MEITYRHGTLADAHTVFDVMVKANDDLTRRMGIAESKNIFAEPNFLRDLLQRRGTLFDFLAASAEQF